MSSKTTIKKVGNVILFSILLFLIVTMLVGVKNTFIIYFVQSLILLSLVITDKKFNG